MNVFVLGGNGATGYQVVKQLLKNSINIFSFAPNLFIVTCFDYNKIQA